MTDQPAAAEPQLDIPRIRRRAADCGLSDDDLAQITGIKPSRFEGQLDLHTLSAARLLYLAAALDTPPQNLVQDAPEPEPTTPTDPTTLHAALLDGTRHQPGALAAALGWEPGRFQRAANALHRRLQSSPTSPQRLQRTRESIKLSSTPGLLTDQQREQADAAGYAPSDLTPAEAAAALRLLHHHLAGPDKRSPITSADLALLTERNLTDSGNHHRLHPDLLHALDVPGSTSVRPFAPEKAPQPRHMR
ncbi:hypothetical protein [Kitasatospora griseola]|uniref:hypothetical protein n=1 Tax=Kitasatospora griseola TaxID=2064 RepID=UPI00365BA542